MLAMLAPHSCLARVLVRLEGQNVAAYKLFVLFPGYALSRLAGVWKRLGMLTQARQWLILVLKTDLSSIQTTEQSPNLFPGFSVQDAMICMRGQALDLSDEGCQWAGMDTVNRIVDHRLQ